MHATLTHHIYLQFEELQARVESAQATLSELTITNANLKAREQLLSSMVQSSDEQVQLLQQRSQQAQPKQQQEQEQHGGLQAHHHQQHQQQQQPQAPSRLLFSSSSASAHGPRGSSSTSAGDDAMSLGGSFSQHLSELAKELVQLPRSPAEVQQQQQPQQQPPQQPHGDVAARPSTSSAVAMANSEPLLASLEAHMRANPGSPLEPQQVMEALQQAFLEWRAIGLRMRALPECAGKEALRQRVMDRHRHMNHMNIFWPLLRPQLRSTNFKTLEREEPPPGHWDAVWRAVLTAQPQPPEVYAKLKSLWELFTERSVSDGGGL